MNKIKKFILLTAFFGLFLSINSQVYAQTCYSTFTGSNSYYDSSASYRLNTLINPLSYSMTFPINNKIKSGGITMHWRYSTDTSSTQRAISTIPGYRSFTKTGEGTNIGRGNLSFLTTTKATYYISYKFSSQRGDVLSGIWRVVVN